MNVQISQHALARAEERGATREEIVLVLYEGTIQPANSGRLMKTKIFPFNEWRNGKRYEEKSIAVIYLIERDIYVVVTVVVKYGKFDLT